LQSLSDDCNLLPVYFLTHDAAVNSGMFVNVVNKDKSFNWLKYRMLWRQLLLPEKSFCRSSKTNIHRCYG